MFFYLPKLTGIFFENRQQSNARWAKKTHICLGNATATPNFKWPKITHIGSIWDQIMANLYV